MPTAKAPTTGEQQSMAPEGAETGKGPEQLPPASSPEQRVTLHGIRWETYEGLLKDLERVAAEGARVGARRALLRRRCQMETRDAFGVHAGQPIAQADRVGTKAPRLGAPHGPHRQP
jgi:hypothetical protein